MDSWTPDCCARHLGLWAVEPHWFSEAVSAVKAGRYGVRPRADVTPVAALPGDRKPYQVQQGVAVIPIMGPIVKGGGKWDEVDSVAVRRSVRAAKADDDVGAIMLLIDSPGGTVSGTDELGNDVREAGTVKPTFAHIEDLGASAAYWIASQTQMITASPTSEVGSIGTLAVVEDLSGAAEAEGIKVHVISTGAYKGAFAPGAPVAEEHLAYLQDRVNALNQHFLEAVRKGRKTSAKAVEGWADGRVWIAEKAAEMGLIDGVVRFEKAMEQARKAIPKKTRSTSAAHARAIRIAEAEFHTLPE